MPSLGQGQSGFGSLAGRLTDTYSSPLENVSITLRNAATGSEITAITSRGGRYSFAHLPPGEYTLRAAGPHGIRNVDGIVISPNHQAIVQTMIESEKLKTASVFIPEAMDRSREQRTSAERSSSVAPSQWSPAQASVAIALQPHALLSEASVAPEDLFAVPLPQHGAGAEPEPAARPSLPDPSAVTLPAGFANAAIDAVPGELSATTFETEAGLPSAELGGVDLVTIPAAILGARSVPKAQIAAIAGAVRSTHARFDPDRGVTLERSKLEELPFQSAAPGKR